MGQSLVNNYIHIVFSTKHRAPLIFPPFEAELHRFIGGMCNSLDFQPIIVGGFVDHVHILCRHSKRIGLEVMMCKMKANSSRWVKSLDKSLSGFYWQDGYGSFSVDPNNLQKVGDYISNQHVHHGGKSFQDEYRAILRKYGVDYDERYVWD